MIRIDNDYVVEVDQYEYRPMKDLHKVDKQGKPMYKCMGHYASLRSALYGIYRQVWKEELADGEHTLTEAIRELEKIEMEISRKLEVIKG